MAETEGPSSIVHDPTGLRLVEGEFHGRFNGPAVFHLGCWRVFFGTTGTEQDFEELVAVFEFFADPFSAISNALPDAMHSAPMSLVLQQIGAGLNGLRPLRSEHLIFLAAIDRTAARSALHARRHV